MEVGLANGVSALYFLAAHKLNGKGGTHTAMDPFQSTDWRGIGLKRVEDVAMKPFFDFREEFSSSVLPPLSKERSGAYGIIFIDGNHRFDDALVDFTLSDPLCGKNGYILMHDTWLASVRRAASFIENNRSDYVRRESPVANVAVFQKIGTDKRSWYHYEAF
jgi:hypothetical protein